MSVAGAPDPAGAVEATEGPDPAQPEPFSVGSEAARIVNQASPLRLVLRLLVVVGLVVATVLGGWFGYRRWQVHQVHGVPMVAFPKTLVIIGNDLRGRIYGEAGVEERPAHLASVDAFELDVTEVTVAAYSVCVRDDACPEPTKGKLCTGGREDLSQHPVTCVTQAEAAQYCAWAGKRLPTEVEWEYAAGGAGDKRLFPWGKELPDAGRANVCGIECTHGARPARLLHALFEFDDESPTTAPVGSYPAGNTPEGLKDMAGNVWEWTDSAVCDYPSHSCLAGPERIIRGGGWTHRYLLSPEVTTREKFRADQRSEGVGFRCAR